CRPKWRRGDETRLHETASRKLVIFERALELNPVGWGQGLQNFGLIFRFEIGEYADRIVAFEIADAFGHGLVRQLRKNLLADSVVHFGERREIERGPHHLDEFWAQFRFERRNEKAEIGLVQPSGAHAHSLRVASLNGRGYVLQELRPP